MTDAVVISSEASHIYIILFFSIVNGASNCFGACQILLHFYLEFMGACGFHVRKVDVVKPEAGL